MLQLFPSARSEVHEHVSEQAGEEGTWLLGVLRAGGPVPGLSDTEVCALQRAYNHTAACCYDWAGAGDRAGPSPLIHPPSG